jgi:microcystin-dependent protein
MQTSDARQWSRSMLTGLLALLPCFSWADGDPFLGEIRWVAFGHTPQRWAPCNGQLLSIAQNSALFSLLGTAYGGNGWSTFALPDMRGRAPLHVAGDYHLGGTGGVETHTLTLAELPPHTHMVQVDGREATQAVPGAAAFLAKTSAGTSAYGQTPNTHLATESVSSEGAGQPHTNMKPFIALNCIIALQGVFPQRE